jgi:ribonuclease I
MHSFVQLVAVASAVTICCLQTTFAQAPAPSATLQLPPILPQGVELGNYGAVTTNNKIFLPPPTGTSQRSLCNIGPSVWCQSEANQRACGVYNKTIGVCGYATTVGNCTVMPVQQFCANSTLKPLAFNGGLSAAPQGNLGLLVLALYWAPSSCQANSSAGGGFCSQYSQAGYPAATNLALHGMWPDTGSLYASDPLAPTYQGAYQGWTQYCDGPDGNFGQCSVGTGNLCSWPNATQANFTQSNYESCMRATNVTACQVSEDTVTALLPLFQRYAPGYLGDDRTFLDHEFFKHGSCIGGTLTRNKTAFFERAVSWTATLTAPGGSAAADLVQNNVGKNITIASMLTALGRQGNPQCSVNAAGLCKLSEIWYCMGVDSAGYPTGLIDCPSGSQLGTCDANKCANSTILIPSYDAPAATAAASTG